MLTLTLTLTHILLTTKVDIGKELDVTTVSGGYELRIDGVLRMQERVRVRVRVSG